MSERRKRRTTCVICLHPQVDEINEWCRDKKITGREIIEAFNIPRDQRAISHHRRMHLGIYFFRKRPKKPSDEIQKVVVVNRPVASLATQRPAPAFGPASPVFDIRSLDNRQRERIRGELDKRFDVATSTYCEGYSDQRIGEELHIPWRAVSNLRELAYGPLKAVEVPLAFEIVSLNSRLKVLEDAIGKLRTDILKLNS